MSNAQIFEIAGVVTLLVTLYSYNQKVYLGSIRLSIIDRLFNTKLNILKRTLCNYRVIFTGYSNRKHRNDPIYSISNSDIDSAFEVVAKNLLEDYYHSLKFKNLAHLHIDNLVRRRLYCFSIRKQHGLRWEQSIASDLREFIEDLNIKEECGFDEMNLNVHMVDARPPLE